MRFRRSLGIYLAAIFAAAIEEAAATLVTLDVIAQQRDALLPTKQRQQYRQGSDGDGTLRGLRSLGPTGVSASIITRFGLRLGGSSTESAVTSTAVGSAVPSTTLIGPPACASIEILRCSIMASSCSSVRFLTALLC
jgi:hypothetical protein